MTTRAVLTKSEALDLAADLYLAGHIARCPTWDDDADDIARLLAPWRLTVLDEDDDQ